MDGNRIGSLVEPLLAEHGLELEAVEIQPAGKRTVVRVVVDGDGPEGHGPGLDDIAAATQQVSAALDDSEVTGTGPFTLEVSSRGVSRPLTKPQHWRRNTGRLVQVSLAEGDQFTGRVSETGDDTVTLEVDGEERTVELSAISKALVQVEFNRKDR